VHELALVDSIFQIINLKIKELQLEKISQVKLVIGEMKAVEEMTLSACFEVFAKDTIAEGAELIFERVPLRGKCRQCGQTFKVKKYRFICPECGDNAVEVISGKEFYIDSLLAE
jgi:hydrogenase nickel incorporation protein HypA/HybF